MKRHRVRLWLTLSLIAMVLIPSAAAYLQIEDVLNSSFTLSSNEETVEALEIGQTALKELAKKIPESEPHYREQFMRIQELKLSLADRALVRQGLVRSYTSYFLISFVTMMLIAIFLALFLSRKVAKAYDQSFNELVRQRERSQFLESLARWQDVAKQLAHEIKNPLQPIGTWMRNLVTSFRNQKNPDQFQLLLDEAAESVGQEIEQLHGLVDSFTQFSRLPEPQFKKVDIFSFLNEFQKRYQESWDVTWDIHLSETELFVKADPNLLRQVLTNLVNNAVESNKDSRISVLIRVAQTRYGVALIVENTGKTIDADISEKIFEPYFSTKTGNANFGLGLAIVRKVMIEHGGDIHVESCSTGARFKLLFPFIGE